MTDNDRAAFNAAIAALKSRGAPLYTPDIVRESGLKRRAVFTLLREREHKAYAKPNGRATIPWFMMKGDSGGLATTQDERLKAEYQREKSMRSQAKRHLKRCRTESQRNPSSEEWAERYAVAAARYSQAAYKTAISDIDAGYLKALIDSGLAGAEVVKRKTALMSRIKAAVA